MNVTTDSGDVTDGSVLRDSILYRAVFPANVAFLVLDFFIHRPLPGPQAGPPRLCMYSCITHPRPEQWGHDDQAVMFAFAAGFFLRIDSPVRVKR